MSESFDAVIVGGGLAGLVAANRAAQLGLRPLVLEKGTEDRYPCNSRITSGVCHVASSSIELPAAEIAAAIEKASGAAAKPELVAALAGDCARAVAWLRGEGGKFVGLGVGYVNKRRHLVLAPPRRFRAGLDWEGRGGDYLLRTLEAGLEKRGGVLRRGVRATRLVMDGDVCRGVEAEAGGAVRRFDAPAVVIADGGFQANREMVGRHISPRPDRILLRAAPSGDGSGILMAQAVGAAMTELGTFYGHLQCADAMTSDRLWPYPNMDVIAVAAIVVDARGRRFTDEGRGAVPLTNAVARLDDPLSATAIFDEAIWNGAAKEGIVPPNPYLIDAGGTRLSAPDLAGLAQAVGVPAGALAESVAAYNKALADGTTDRLDPPRSTARSPAFPIASGPFHAVRLCAGLTNTMGGLAIDADARVLRADASAIGGLFAAGSCTGGLEGGERIGYAGGLVKAFVFGLRAAESIARDQGRAVQ
jgi:fumarate reductase flavoprotein subunit